MTSSVDRLEKQPDIQHPTPQRPRSRAWTAPRFAFWKLLSELPTLDPDADDCRTSSRRSSPALHRYTTWRTVAQGDHNHKTWVIFNTPLPFVLRSIPNILSGTWSCSHASAQNAAENILTLSMTQRWYPNSTDLFFI